METNSLPSRLRKAIAEFDADQAPRGAVTRFCAQHGISRSVFYKIRAQGAANPGATPLPASRAPATSPARTSRDMEELAIRTRLALIADGWDAGPLSVRERLTRDGHTRVPSRATLARVFSRAGLVAP
jgi:hypothetical protein